jgi:ATP-binding cassette subfamily F protein uup
LLDYEGTLLLVSHDRAFLNNIVTSTFALDSSGQVTETVGGYDDWLQQSGSAKPESKPRKSTADQNSAAPTSAEQVKKLSYKEKRALEEQKRELAELPGRIEKLEADIHKLTAEMAIPTFYQQESAEITLVVNQLKEMQEKLAQAYHKWEELEKLESK